MEWERETEIQRDKENGDRSRDIGLETWDWMIFDRLQRDFYIWSFGIFVYSFHFISWRPAEKICNFQSPSAQLEHFSCCYYFIIENKVISFSISIDWLLQQCWLDNKISLRLCLSIDSMGFQPSGPDLLHWNCLLLFRFSSFRLNTYTHTLLRLEPPQWLYQMFGICSKYRPFKTFRNCIRSK